MTHWTESQLKQHTQKQSMKAIADKSKVSGRKSTQTPSKAESVVKDANGFIRLPIEPMGAVRLSSSDRWSKRPRAQKYFDWKNRFKTIISNIRVESTLKPFIHYLKVGQRKKSKNIMAHRCEQSPTRIMF